MSPPIQVSYLELEGVLARHRVPHHLATIILGGQATFTGRDGERIALAGSPAVHYEKRDVPPSARIEQLQVAAPLPAPAPSPAVAPPATRRRAPGVAITERVFAATLSAEERQADDEVRAALGKGTKRYV